MIKYSLLDGNVTVSLDVDNPNAVGKIIYEGEVAEYVREVLSQQYGAFGHFIGDRTSPIDLDAAMNSSEMAMFSPVLIEGSKPEYNPDIPDGATT